MLFASCVDCWLLHPPLLLITNRTCKYVILITWAIIFRETHNKIKPKCVFPWMKLFLWSQCLRTILPGEFVFFSAQKFKDYTVPVYEWFSKEFPVFVQVFDTFQNEQRICVHPILYFVIGLANYHGFFFFLLVFQSLISLNQKIGMFWSQFYIEF